MSKTQMKLNKTKLKYCGLTFHLHSVHCSWLVNNPENGCSSIENAETLGSGMAQTEFHGLNDPFSRPLSPLQPDIISDDLAKIIPGFMERQKLETLDIDWVDATT